jgi:thioredoxin 1
MISHKRRTPPKSRQTQFRGWLVLLVIVSLAFWLGGCGADASKRVVAEVNGQRITLKDVQDDLGRIPEEMRIIYEQNPGEVLDRLISLTLLLQEAERRGLVDSVDLRGLDNPSIQGGMQRLMEMELKGADKVTDEEVSAFYQQNLDQMGGKSLSQVREPIRAMLLEQKQQQRISDFVGKLRTKASVTAYPERLPKPPPSVLEASTAQEFREALQSGRPSVVDFGSNRCIPCIQLRPVLRAVKDAHGDRINVIFMEVNEHRDLVRQYKVQLIPTLIFFDAKGREAHRKMGFMDHEAMEKALHELGFLGG